MFQFVEVEAISSRVVMCVVAGSVTELSINNSHRRLEHLVPRHHDVTRSTAATSSATTHNAVSLHCSPASALSQYLNLSSIHHMSSLQLSLVHRVLTAAPSAGCNLQLLNHDKLNYTSIPWAVRLSWLKMSIHTHFFGRRF